MTEIISTIADTGVAGLLAALLIYIWKAEHEANTDEEDRHREVEEKQMAIIQANTQAIEALTELIKEKVV